MRLARGHQALSVSMAAVALIGATLVSAGLAPAGATTTSPLITVKPHTNLADGEIVKVAGSGFPANAGMAMAECKVGGPATVSDCDIGVSQLFESGKNGTFAVSFEVARYIEVGGVTLDCAKPSTCKLSAATYPHVTKAHDGVVLSFNPKRKAVGPVVKVSPTTSIAPNELVTVRGHGYLPGGEVDVTECTKKGVCQAGADSVTGDASATGTLSLQYRPSSKLLVFTGGPGPSFGRKTVSCEHAPGCILEVVGGSRLEDDIEIPISFDPHKAPIVPSMSLSASTGLANGQIITVSGSGFAANEPVNIRECPAGEYPGSCDIADGATTFAGTDGDVSAQLPVTEKSGSGSGAINCSVTSCVVVLADGNDVWFASDVALTFDSSLPEVTPSLTVTPDSQLSSGQVVTVSGSAFPAGADVGVVECPLGSSPTPCIDGYFGPFVLADASGGFTDGLQVSVETPDGESCSAKGECRVVAFNSDDETEWTNQRISFAAGT